MADWIDQYPRLVDALKRENGSWDHATPKLRAKDMIALLGIYSAAIPGAIERVADGVGYSMFVDRDGRSMIPMLARISARTYTFESVAVDSKAPWRRVPSTDALRRSFEPYREPTLVRHDQIELIGFTRQLMADYTRCVNAIASAVLRYPYQVASRDDCAVFLSALRATGADLSVLGENPPTTLSEDVKGALGAALDASEAATVKLAEAAGDAAAWVGNAAGKVAGAAASGFFDRANLITLAVAGVVGFVALKRVGVV